MELSEALKPAKMQARILKLGYHDTEDAAQEARIAVWRAWDSGKRDPTYLRVVAKRGALRWLVQGNSFGKLPGRSYEPKVKVSDEKIGETFKSRDDYYPSDLGWALNAVTSPLDVALVEGVSRGLTPREIGISLGYVSDGGTRRWRVIRPRLQQAWKETQV